MALTSSDETDLLLPLYQGLKEEPHFSTFLERLRRRTEAENVAILVRRKQDAKAPVHEFFAGIDLSQRARELGIHELYSLQGVQRDRLRPGRVYAVSEFIDHDPDYRRKRSENIARLGIKDERVLRFAVDDTLDAWLTLARSSPCSAADSALLSSVAPYVAAVLRSMVDAEREQVALATASRGLMRAGTGWILFDNEARVIAADEITITSLGETARIGCAAGQRLRGIPDLCARELLNAAKEIASNPDAPARIVLLSEQPRIEAMLGPAEALTGTLLEQPAMLATCRLPRPASEDRARSLAAAYELPFREAELAIALSDGKSIAEAADAMGLTIETARNYSKRLYSKLGVKGQAGLVRAVYESSAVLA